jgi:hypothetical protein
MRGTSGRTMVLVIGSLKGFPFPAVILLLYLGPCHFSGELAVVSADRYGVWGDGVDGEVSPSLGRNWS